MHPINRSIAAVAACALCAVPLFADDATDQFNFATGLLIRDEPALAADEFKKLVEEHPDFAEMDSALYRWGEALAKSEQKDAAKPVFERLVRECPQSERVPEARYWLARIASEVGDHRVAAGHYASVYAQSPDSPLAEASRYGAIDSLYKAEAWKEVADACAAALDAAPDGKYAAETRLLRAWSLEKLGDDAAALDAYRDFAARHADSPQATECRLQAANCLRRLGRAEEAANAYAELLGIEGATGAEARISRAFCLHDLGRHAEAAASFAEAAQRLGEGDAKAATCTMNAAHEYAAAEDFEHAAEAYAAAEKAGQPAAYWLGSTLMRLGRVDEAIEAMRRAVAQETDATSAEQKLAARSSVAMALFRAGRHEEAVDALRDAIAHETAETGAEARLDSRAALASALFKLERYADADKAFADAIAAVPEGAKPEAAVMYQYAWCALNAGDKAAARKRFEGLAAAHPESGLAPEALVRAAQIAAEAGEADEADALYARAAEVAPESPFAARALASLAASARAKERYEDSLKYAREVVARFPGEEALQPFAHLCAAEALIGLKRPEEALEEYRKVDGGDDAMKADAAFGAACALRELGRHAEAADAFAPLAEGEGEGAGNALAEDALWWRAVSLADAGKDAEAAECFGAFAERFPESARAADAAYQRALGAYRAKDWAKADALYLEFQEKHGDGALALQALYDWAWVALESGDAEKGEARLREVVARAPGDQLAADAGFRVGEIAFDAGRHADAAAAYEAALAVPGIPFADKLLYKLGWAKIHLDAKEEALAAFGRLVRECPQSELAGEALYLEGKLTYELGRMVDAAAALAKVEDPAFAEKALYLLAECHRAEGRHGEAIAAYDKVLAQWPEGETRAAALLGKGHSLRASGADADALDAYAAVVKATETIDAAHAIMGQGDIHYGAQRWQDAAKEYLKIDILYGYEELKPRALLMLARTWKQAGDEAKAAKYREQLKQRYPESAEAKEAEE